MWQGDRVFLAGSSFCHLAKGLRQENPRSRLTWEVPAEVGKDVEVTYTYKVLIRR